MSVCPQKFGADDEARTRYLHLGKVALYQMSYARETVCIIYQKTKFVNAKKKKIYPLPSQALFLSRSRARLPLEGPLPLWMR